MRGKFLKKYKIDDYIIAAMDIYIEIIVIFKMLLSMLNNWKKKNDKVLYSINKFFVKLLK